MVKGQQLSNNISIWWDGWTVKLLPSIGMSGHIDQWKLTFIDLWKTNDVTHVHKSVLLVSDFIWKIYLQKLPSLALFWATCVHKNNSNSSYFSLKQRLKVFNNISLLPWTFSTIATPTSWEAYKDCCHLRNIPRHLTFYSCPQVNIIYTLFISKIMLFKRNCFSV